MDIYRVNAPIIPNNMIIIKASRSPFAGGRDREEEKEEEGRLCCGEDE